MFNTWPLISDADAEQVFISHLFVYFALYLCILYLLHSTHSTKRKPFTICTRFIGVCVCVWVVRVQNGREKKTYWSKNVHQKEIVYYYAHKIKSTIYAICCCLIFLTGDIKYNVRASYHRDDAHTDIYSLTCCSMSKSVDVETLERSCTPYKRSTQYKLLFLHHI